MTERAAAQANARNRAPVLAIARDRATTGDRGVNSAVGTNAGNAPIHFPLKRSGVLLEKLAGKNIGSLEC